MRPRVVLHPLTAPGLGAALGEIEGIDLVMPPDEDGVCLALDGGAEVLVTLRWRDRFLTPGLRWVQATTAGVEQFPREDLRARKVILCSAGDVHAPVVSLHAITLLLALVRGVGPAMRAAARGVWAPDPATAQELSGSTLGILGLGSIGEEVARLGGALGMRVIGTKRDPQGYAGVAEDVVGPGGTLDVCRRADAVVVTLPGGPENEGMVGAAELEALGAGWLVSVGRGTVVDEDALVRVLRDGPLRGAALDVMCVEPLPADSPLWDLPNALLTPHVAWASDRLPGRLAALFRHNLDAYRERGPWRARVC